MARIGSGGRRGRGDRRELPCHTVDPELFFAETPAELELAKEVCRRCPVRLACLAGALERAEVAGVWGGQILDHGTIIARKRPRGRPRKVRPHAPLEPVGA